MRVLHNEEARHVRPAGLPDDLDALALSMPLCRRCGGMGAVESDDVWAASPHRLFPTRQYFSGFRLPATALSCPRPMRH